MQPGQCHHVWSRVEVQWAAEQAELARLMRWEAGEERAPRGRARRDGCKGSLEGRATRREGGEIGSGRNGFKRRGVASKQKEE